MKKLIFVILTLLTVTGLCQPVKDFNLLNVVDGKSISLTNYGSAAGVVIIFTLNNCPFDAYYVTRIKSLAEGKVPILLVNSSPDETDSNENMLKRATQLGLTIPYIADKDQSLMIDLNARKSTEAFLLKNNNGKFMVYYHGAIDDNPQVSGDVKYHYLSDAITKMLTGQKAEVIDARPVGCNIRRK